MKLLYLTIISLLSWSILGCSDHDGEDPLLPGEEYIPLFSGNIDGFENTWQGSDTGQTDSICIYAVKDGNVIVAEQTYIPATSAGQTDFTTGEQAPIILKNSEEYVFYSYRTGQTSPLAGTEGIAVVLDRVQQQLKGNDITHVRQYDFIYAKSETRTEEVSFRYTHTFALLEFDLPAGVQAITLRANDPNEEYAGEWSFSLKTDSWNYYDPGYPFISLQLGEPTAKNGEKAWMVIFPGHSGKPFDLIVQTADYKIYRIRKYVPAEGYLPGQKYAIKIDLQEADQILTPPTRNANAWQIANARDMEWFRDNVNSGASDMNAVLVTDIDLEGSEENPWWPIGSSNYYTGHFNGNGYHISGLHVNDIKNDGGLWAVIDTPARIENLELSGEITGKSGLYAGSIVSYINGGSVTGCHSRVNINVKNISYVGGITAFSFGQISDCYYSGNIQVTGHEAHAGGVLGTNNGITENCYFSGALTFACAVAGGISGGNGPDGIVRNCASLCREWKETGGLLTLVKGRIVGYTLGKSYNNIAYDGMNIGSSFSEGESTHGTGKDWTECLSPATYTSELGWSPEIWGFSENALPYLKVIKSTIP